MTVILEAKNLTKSYGGVRVVDDLSVSLEEGEALGVVGPNGAGKTSMLNLLTGAVHPDVGTVVFAGRDISRMPPEERCHLGLGRTYQIPRPFEGMTVFENVLVGGTYGRRRSEKASYEICARALEQTSLLPRANVLAETLSLLERKRLELARALATEPKVLLLDEIAGGLTEHEVQSLIETIRQLRAQGITIIWIEHIVHALLAVVDRLLAIDFGHLIAEGDPKTVINSPEVRDVYMGEYGAMSLLELTNISTGYGHFQALFDVNLTIEEGETHAVIGANGAGKSTLLRTVCGLLRAEDDSVRFDGRPIGQMSPHKRVGLGISYVPEGRWVFPSLTVNENLLVGAHSRRTGIWTLDKVYELFPLLSRLRQRQAFSLSGGEQQALAIARGLMSNPRLLLLDEVSLGLAPVVVEKIYEAMPAIVGSGTTVLLVEQDVGQAMKFADRITCMLEGRLVLEGAPGQISQEAIFSAYFGV